MDSVLLDPSSPDQLHSNFSEAANGAAQSIKQFTQLVEDGKTKEVMDKAKESRAGNNEGIIGWQVTDHEDWLDVNKEDGSEDKDKEDEGIADAGGDSVHAALDRFRSAHVGVEASMDEDSRTVTVGHFYGFARIVLMIASSIYLRQPRSISRFRLMPLPKAITVIMLIATASQNFTERFLRQSEHEPEQTI